MNENINNLINRYFDNELSKNEEVLLFTQLSQNDEARDFFKEMNLLRTVVEGSMEQFPSNLDSKILSNIKVNDHKKEKIVKSIPIKISTLINYGLILILFALSILFYTESKQLQDKLEFTHYQVHQQNQMIQVLFNTLPQAEVKAKFSNDIIITPQM